MGRYAASGIHGYLALGSNGENRSLEWPHVLEAPVHGNAARRTRRARKRVVAMAGLSSLPVPPSRHALAATSARACIGAGMAVPLNRRASLDDLPAVLTLERRDLQPRAGAARSGERYLAREFASLLQ